ncbi:protein FAM124A [Trichomycterus rosablanca]|uniref:protein FAM124A n=1 Tax=Trichomycterus rosablanca TaxID=2290929 RepID=UPI002F3501C0
MFIKDLQDPFLVSLHIITDPGEARKLQHAADQLLTLLHPQLTLCKVTERAERTKLQCLKNMNSSLHPYLCIILFLQEDFREHEYQELQLRRPLWLYHHTERIKGSSFSAIQDFFTLAPGTPLWALRHISYGKGTVRFTVYCRHETYSEQVRLYKLLLRRPLAHMNKVFCFCVVYSNQHTEIQLALRRLPQGRNPGPADCTIMEIRVRNLEGLVPYLPHACKPISEHRWQTEDYDGNKILLQVQGSGTHFKPPIPALSSVPFDSGITFIRPFSETSNSDCQSSSSSRVQVPLTQPSQTSETMLHKQKATEGVQHGEEIACARTLGPRTHSQFSVTTKAFHSTNNFPSSYYSIPRFRINVDVLVGAEETDVDTGRAVSSSCVDLSVVSAYSQTRLLKPLCASLQDLGSNVTEPLSISLPLKQTSSSTSNIALPLCEGMSPLSDQSHPKSNEGQNLSNATKTSTDGTENKEEFYI